MKLRDSSIDLVKFLLIFLVVLGHSIQFFDVSKNINFDASILYSWIYSFHMPLFMFVSGYLYKVKSLSKHDIYKKFKLLIIPFVFWAIYSSIINRENVLTGIIDVFINPDSGLWFLYILFLCMCTVSFLKLYLSINGILISTLIIILALLGLDIVIGYSSYGIGLYRWQILFFVLGVYLKDKEDVLIEFINNKRYLYLCVFLIVYGFSFLYWERIPSEFKVLSNPLFNSLMYIMIKYTCAIFAIFIFFIMKNTIKFNFDFGVVINKFIIWVSKNTLAFYAIQFSIIDVLIKLNWFQSSYFISVVCFVFCAILISFINRMKLLRMICFGR
ncbi:acyltransferase family protein [Photobacterium kishitanii]|uniref:Acyltransferase 3 domain-containing protein n=1 Tax=Photobacterium kishitanii TaxID=318456 RepID=A0A2T3KA38_9GAMM|nr:acyltransferase family protein [Photobacterium kishitanii]PSU88002.1 hypothetical protein C9J27_25850 [Photobacterium kishitanii]